MGFKIRLVLLIAILAVPASAWAIHPFQVEETTTRGKGNFLFELNDDYSKDSSNRSTELTGILTGGLTERLDLSIDIPYLKLDPKPGTNDISSGMGDAQIRFKHRLFENEVKQSMAYQLYVKLPTGDLDKGLGTNDLYWGLKLMDQQVCHGNILHASLGYEVSGRDMKKWHYADNYAFLFGLAAELKMTEKFWLLTELAGESGKATDRATGVSADSSPFTFMAGFKYDIFKSWYIDLSGRVGLNKYADDYSVLAGTALRF